MRLPVRSRWNAFLFEPSSPVGLAVCRVLFFGTFALYYSRIAYGELGELPPHAWLPVWPFEPLGLTLPSANTLVLLQWLWLAAMAAACIGAAYRWTSVAAFGLGFYLIGLTENVARINHSDAIVVFGLAIMALSRAGDALSIDARFEQRSADRRRESGEYTWPIRAMWAVIVTIYFAAGITKLATSGAAWITSDNLSNLLMLSPVTESPLTLVGQELGRNRVLSSILGALTLTIELTLPLALFSRRARRFLVPSLYAFQLCIRIFMGPGFTEFFICALFWIPWDRLAGGYFRFSSPRVRIEERDVQTYGISGASSGSR